MELQTRINGLKDPVKQLQEKPGKDQFLIVGIGCSAGGVQALQEFFRNTTEDSGMAYVIILHLSPDHDSQLAAILQRETRIPVRQVLDKTQIQSNHIYVVPPDRHLTMEDGHIAVLPNILTEERRAPVDIFFRTLADEHGPRSVAIILSGTGANGSMGLKRVKERGGACFVQNPREAEFKEMPRHAISTKLVDDVLPVAEIPAKILSYKISMHTVEIAEKPDVSSDVQQHALRQIFTQLRQQTGHDFSNYKRATLLRRIERRINVHNLPDLVSYSQLLVEDTEEANALLKDLLISVTNFFRDKKAFEFIEQEVIPHLIAKKTYEEPVRVWVAGCATGEEAYTFAMLLAEKTIGLLDTPRIQIFATDIDESAIVHAREGRYSLNDAADVSPERLKRFFQKDGDGYRIRREIRETVMFAQHNFLKDPPFSHLDMVSCRNVLIYLNQTAQDRSMETFHFALQPGGFLFLGSSESVNGAGDLYAIFNRDNHLFQSRQITARIYPIPESTPSLYAGNLRPVSTAQSEKKILERISFGDLHQQLLEEYAAPSLVINEEYDIIHLTEKAGKYLLIGGGEISKNLLKLVRPELRLELRSALYQATQKQAPVEARGLNLMLDNVSQTINIHIRPIIRSGHTAKGFMLVLFEPTEYQREEEVLLSSDEPVAKRLEEELVRLKAYIRASNEQHDFQAEELKATNEELQAINEELRSAAEELETSKEELQSINEELRTVNQELKIKIEETSIASNNLQNLINSTDIGTLFLDRGFRVALYTPAVRKIFNLIPSDHGRPLSDITSSIDYNGVVNDCQTVLEKFTVVEREVSTKNRTIYLMRITPYRTDEDRIKGVVITFVDITERKRHEGGLSFLDDMTRQLTNMGSNTGLDAVNEKIAGYFSLSALIFAQVAEDRESSIVINSWQKPDYPPIQATYATRDTMGRFGSYNSKDGKITIVRNLLENEDNDDQQINLSNIASFVTVPVMSDGKWRAWLGFYRTAPSEWHPDEIELLREITNRIWMRFQSIKAEEELRRKDAGYRTDLERQVASRTEELMRSNQDLLQFAHVTSHDLKEPVRKIKTFTGLLVKELGQHTSEPAKSYLEKVRLAIDRVGTMIEAILTYSRVGIKELMTESVDLNLVFDHIESDLEFVMTEKSATVTRPNLPTIPGNQTLLEQLFNNLLANSLKFAKKNQPLEVFVTANDIVKDAVPYIEIHFRDNGIGFDPEYNESIFEAFTRLNSKDSYEGTGLGLSLCNKIVRRHKGEIYATGQEGTGALFVILLPK